MLRAAREPKAHRGLKAYKDLRGLARKDHKDPKAHKEQVLKGPKVLWAHRARKEPKVRRVLRAPKAQKALRAP